MDKNEIVVERAKNGKNTCAVISEGKKNYLYSKYEPDKNIKIPDIERDKSYVILGGGLGYEIESIAERTNKPIIVIENNKIFIDVISSNEKIRERINIISEIKEINFNEEKFEIINLKNITSYFPEFYGKVILKIKKRADKKKIVFFEHITIAGDCIEALREAGYEVIKQQWKNGNVFVMEIIENKPDYLFTINFSKKISEISRVFGIPYVAWVVDTPCYSIYSKENYHENVHLFIYDEETAQKLSNHGVENVRYMPVGANVSRYDKILGKKQVYLYDTSFLGTTGFENEYNQYMKNFLSEETLSRIDNIFARQKSSDRYIIRDYIDTKLIDAIENDSRYVIAGDDFISHEEKLGFILGRKYNENERDEMIRAVSDVSTVSIFGDEKWRAAESDKIKYMGEAEHLNEMPKVFARSKININLTRVYVDSGLPMRVFDVMAAGGFLMTNHKSDISRFFIDGEDLVVYTDLMT